MLFSHRYKIVGLCSLLIVFLASVMVPGVSRSAVFAAGPVIKLSQKSGPPPTAITIKGSDSLSTEVRHFRRKNPAAKGQEENTAHNTMI